MRTFKRIKESALLFSLALFYACDPAPKGITNPVAGDSVGVTWTSHNVVGISNNQSVSGVTWSNNMFAGVVYDRVATSTDGITWTEHSISGATGAGNSFSGVVWMGTQWLAYGFAGVTATSPDGVTWTLRTNYVGHVRDTIFTSNLLITAAWSGSTVSVASSNGKIWSSSDGVNWTGYVQMGGDVNRLIWTGTRLVAVGPVGEFFIAPISNWTVNSTSTPNALVDIVWNGSQYVAVGQSGIILTSPDGVAWTRRSHGLADSANTNFSSLVWTGPSTGSGTGQFVAVGGYSGSVNSTYPQGNGIILTSADGVTWTRQNSASTPVLYSVTWTGPSTGSGTGKLVAVGGSSQTIVLTSP